MNSMNRETKKKSIDFDIKLGNGWHAVKPINQPT